MKKILIVFAFVLAFNTSINAQTFTGVLTMETENLEIGEKATTKCYIKFPYCKMEIQSVAKEGTASYTLYFNDAQSDVIMVSAGTRTVIPMASIPTNKYWENILVAIPTGKSQMVMGYTASEVTLKSTNAVIQCLVATELEINMPVMLSSRGIIKSLKENSIAGTPLFTQTKDLSGKIVFTQKITSISQQVLDDSIFTAE